MTKHRTDFAPSAGSTVELGRRTFLVSAAAMAGGLSVGILPAEEAAAAL